MSYLKLAKHLFNTNKELVEKTAIRDCHCLGLNSFIINEKPRIRLFIAEDDSELHVSSIHDLIVPVHPHKYDDLFQVINGKVINHIYEDDEDGWQFNRYSYPRIGDEKQQLIHTGVRRLKRTEVIIKKTLLLPAQALHTVSVKGTNVMWMVTELGKDICFNQTAYSIKPLKWRNELYKSFPGAIDYVAQKLIELT